MGALAGHRHVGTDRTPREGGHQPARRHRHAGRGALLRDLGRLLVQMDVGVAMQVRVEAVACGVGAPPRQRGAHRLPHDLALAPGQGQRPGTGPPAGFDDDHLAAARRHAAQPGGDIRPAGATGGFDVRLGLVSSAAACRTRGMAPVDPSLDFGHRLRRRRPDIVPIEHRRRDRLESVAPRRA